MLNHQVQIIEIQDFFPDELFVVPGNPRLQTLGRAFFRTLNLFDLFYYNYDVLDDLLQQLENNVQEIIEDNNFVNLPVEVREKQHLTRCINLYLKDSWQKHEEMSDFMFEQMDQFKTAVIESGDPSAKNVSDDIYEEAQIAVQEFVQSMNLLNTRDYQLIVYLRNILSG